MSRQAVLRAFARLITPELEALGFGGKRGHFVRRLGNVTQVIELQHSIYGGRITANLGLDLEFLKPLVRWIAQPALGPHAHDATRWVRVGLVRPEHADCWWSFDADTEEGCDDAAKSCGRAILDHGITWLETERTPVAFLRYAETRLERTKCAARPEGSYLELRLMAAVLAWNGEIAKARSFAESARRCWSEERARLAMARDHYRKKNPQATGRVPGVPDIQAELDSLIDASGAPPTLPSAPARSPSRVRRVR